MHSPADEVSHPSLLHQAKNQFQVSVPNFLFVLFCFCLVCLCSYQEISEAAPKDVFVAVVFGFLNLLLSLAF